jgi:hypothetical protein
VTIADVELQAQAVRIREDPWLPKAKLSACQGWEALYPVAGEYAVSCEPSLLHLERIGDVGKGTWNRLFVEGLEIVNFKDHTRLIDVRDRERERCILHPESGVFGLLHDKKHSAVWGEILAKHQPRYAFLRLIGNFRGHSPPGHAERDGRQRNLGGFLREDPTNHQKQAKKGGTIHARTHSGTPYRAKSVSSHPFSAFFVLKKTIAIPCVETSLRNSPVSGRK